MELFIPLFFLCFMSFFVGLSLLTAVFWIWMLIDCVMHEPSEGNDKLVWVLIIIFAQFVGALIYFFVRRQPRLKSGLSENKSAPSMTRQR